MLIGLIFAAYINGVARQPEARGMLQPIAFLGFALAEALAIFGLALAFVFKALTRRPTTLGDALNPQRILTADDESGWAPTPRSSRTPESDLRPRHLRASCTSSWRAKVVPRLEQIFAERTAAIEGGIEKAEEASAEAQAAREQYQSQLPGRGPRPARMREDARPKARRSCRDAWRAAGCVAHLRAAQKQIEAERQQAMV